MHQRRPYTECQLPMPHRTHHSFYAVRYTVLINGGQNGSCSMKKAAPLDQLCGNTRQTHTPRAQLGQQNHPVKPLLLLFSLYAAYEESTNSCRTRGLTPKYFVQSQVSPLWARNSTFLGNSQVLAFPSPCQQFAWFRQNQPEQQNCNLLKTEHIRCPASILSSLMRQRKTGSSGLTVTHRHHRGSEQLSDVMLKTEIILTVLLPQYLIQLARHQLSITHQKYTMWVKKVAPLKLFAIISLRLSIFLWNFANLLPVYIHTTCLPILVNLS